MNKTILLITRNGKGYAIPYNEFGNWLKDGSIKDGDYVYETTKPPLIALEIIEKKVILEKVKDYND